MKTNLNRLLVGLITLSLVLAGCAPAELPKGAGAVWHLVILSDSSLWEVGEAYAARIEKDMGVKVVLEDYSFSAMSAGNVLNVLKGKPTESARMEKLPSVLAEAEVVVMFLNPDLSIMPGNPLDLSGCFMREAPKNCELAAMQQWIADLKAIWAEIFRLRQGKATILRATDIYNPLVADWKKAGIFDTCTACWVNQSAANRQAAEAFKIPFLNRYDLMNGADHAQDIVAKGYISDGEHLSKAGAQVVADLLAQMGYQPVSPPK